MSIFRLAAIGLMSGLALVLGVGFGHLSAQTASPEKPVAPAVKTERATFAGGCFWCVEFDFDKIDGVVSTVSGFMGGTTANPTYKQVTSGGTGHIEVVQIEYDPSKVTYRQLVEHLWRTIDPYDAGGQFCDRGESYTTAIFAHSPEQKQVAEASKAELARRGPLKQPIATTIRDAGTFTAAEDYHQDFYTKNPVRYKFYRYGCGRDQRIEAIWGKKASN
jgi:peptide-methionine (S)-S-oxide reductase